MRRRRSRWRRATLHTALAVTDELLASVETMGLTILLPTTLRLRAQALWALGHTEEAHTALLEARRELRPWALAPASCRS